MPKNRFEEITQFLHLYDLSREPARGDVNFDRLYKFRPALNAVLKFNAVICPRKTFRLTWGL